jgi:hypothetical protein
MLWPIPAGTHSREVRQMHTHTPRPHFMDGSEGWSVSVTETDSALLCLSAAGIVRPIISNIPPRGGRPAERWQVNPALAKGVKWRGSGVAETAET